MEKLGGMQTYPDYKRNKLRSLGGSDSLIDFETGSSSHITQRYESSGDKQIMTRKPGDQVYSQEREIEQVAQGINDLAHIFQNLHMLVIDQGSVLDRIDYNVEKVNEHVRVADQDLKHAYKRKRRLPRYCIIIVLLLGIIVLSIMLVAKRKRSPQAPNQGKLPNSKENGAPFT